MNQLSLLLGRTAGQVMRGEELQLNNPERIRLLAVANSLGIMHLLYNRLTETLTPDMVPVSLFKQEMETVFQNTAQADMWVKMQKAFEENGVDILMLKGIQLRNLYPDPESREMCDIDLLYRYGQKRKVKKVMEKLGFKLALMDSHHMSYFDGRVTVELHHTICNADNYNNPFFRGLFERSEQVDGMKHIYKMRPDDLYIGTVLHIHRHICESEYSLKRLCDIFILKQQCDIDSKNIKKQLTSLNISELAGWLNKACELIFENKESDAETQEFADAFFGIIPAKNEIADEVKKSSFNKIKYFLSELFPRPAKIYVTFPWVLYHRWLLPAGYIVRIFQGLGKRKKYAETKLKNAEKEIRKGESEFARKFGIEP